MIARLSWELILNLHYCLWAILDGGDGDDDVFTFFMVHFGHMHSSTRVTRTQALLVNVLHSH